MNCLIGRFAGWRSVALIALAVCLSCPGMSQAGWLRAWGDNRFGQCEVPPGDDFVAVAATAHTGMALREDGSVVFWGEDFDGYLQRIWTGNDFVTIASGGMFGAIKRDGSLFTTVGAVPAGNDFVDIAVSGHGLALREDGTLVGWGRNHFDQAEVPAGNDFAAVAAGLNSSMVLKEDGTIVGWGYGGDWSTGPEFAAIAAQWGNKLGLRKDGSLKSWGLGEEAPEGNDFAAIACGWYHSLAIRTDGSLVAWGGSNGSWVVDVPPGNHFVDIAAGVYHSVAIEVPEPSTLAALLTMAATAALIAWHRGWRFRAGASRSRCYIWPLALRAGIASGGRSVIMGGRDIRYGYHLPAVRGGT